MERQQQYKHSQVRKIRHFMLHDLTYRKRNVDSNICCKYCSINKLCQILTQVLWSYLVERNFSLIVVYLQPYSARLGSNRQGRLTVGVCTYVCARINDFTLYNKYSSFDKCIALSVIRAKGTRAALMLQAQAHQEQNKQLV